VTSREKIVERVNEITNGKGVPVVYWAPSFPAYFRTRGGSRRHSLPCLCLV
jgi:hypothetical protein